MIPRGKLDLVGYDNRQLYKLQFKGAVLSSLSRDPNPELTESPFKRQKFTKPFAKAITKQLVYCGIAQNVGAASGA